MFEFTEVVIFITISAIIFAFEMSTKSRSLLGKQRNDLSFISFIALMSLLFRHEGYEYMIVICVTYLTVVSGYLFTTLDKSFKRVAACKFRESNPVELRKTIMSMDEKVDVYHTYMDTYQYVIKTILAGILTMNTTAELCLLRTFNDAGRKILNGRTKGAKRLLLKTINQLASLQSTTEVK